jgi:hypothetical protein
MTACSCRRFACHDYPPSWPVALFSEWVLQSLVDATVRLGRQLDTFMLAGQHIPPITYFNDDAA